MREGIARPLLLLPQRYAAPRSLRPLRRLADRLFGISGVIISRPARRWVSCCGAVTFSWTPVRPIGHTDKQAPRTFITVGLGRGNAPVGYRSRDAARVARAKRGHLGGCGRRRPARWVPRLAGSG